MPLNPTKPPRPTLDALDKCLLMLLQQNGRTTNAKLAIAIERAAGPTLERVRRLEKEGFIHSYHARLNRKKLGFSFMAFVSMDLRNASSKERAAFIAGIGKAPEVWECHRVMSSGQYMLKVITLDSSAYEAFIEALCDKHPQAYVIHATPVLSTHKEIPKVNLENDLPAGA